MHDDFAETTLKAVRETNPANLYVAVDDLGTTVQGHPDRVFAYTEELFVRAAAAAEHVTATLLFDRRKACRYDNRTADRSRAATRSEFFRRPNWALYPLGAGDYSDVIVKAIEDAISRSRG